MLSGVEIRVHKNKEEHGELCDIVAGSVGIKKVVPCRQPIIGHYVTVRSLCSHGPLVVCKVMAGGTRFPGMYGHPSFLHNSRSPRQVTCIERQLPLMACGATPCGPHAPDSVWLESDGLDHAKVLDHAEGPPACFVVASDGDDQTETCLKNVRMTGPASVWAITRRKLKAYRHHNVEAATCCFGVILPYLIQPLPGLHNLPFSIVSLLFRNLFGYFSILFFTRNLYFLHFFTSNVNMNVII